LIDAENKAKQERLTENKEKLKKKSLEKYALIKKSLFRHCKSCYNTFWTDLQNSPKGQM
jgi:DNA polymerase sigma